MFKKRIGLVLCLALLLVPIMGATDNAAVIASSGNNFTTQGNAIVPLAAYTRSTYTNLAIVSGTATCVASLTGFSGITTQVDITMYLEKRYLFIWMTDTSWSQTFYSYSGSMSEQHSVSSGTYRVKAVYVAYSGSNSETITGYSDTITY